MSRTPSGSRPPPGVGWPPARRCTGRARPERAAQITPPAIRRAEDREPYRALLGEFNRRMAFGSPFYLSQCELAYDWPAYVARLHLAAAEVSGAKTGAGKELGPVTSGR